MEVGANTSLPGPSGRGVVNKTMHYWRRMPPGPARADDSGIDSDEEQRNLAFVNDFMQATESSSSEEDGFRFRFRFPHVLPNLRRQKAMMENNNGAYSPDEMDSDAGPDPPYERADREHLAHCDAHDIDSPNRDQELVILDSPIRTARPMVEDGLSDNGRDSSSLLEVELTASDEDDDASVLELVIPMQQNMRYQRVPSNITPKKRHASVFWIGFLCCIPRKVE